MGHRTLSRYRMTTIARRLHTVVIAVIMKLDHLRHQELLLQQLGSLPQNPHVLQRHLRRWPQQRHPSLVRGITVAAQGGPVPSARVMPGVTAV